MMLMGKDERNQNFPEQRYAEKAGASKPEISRIRELMHQTADAIDSWVSDQSEANLPKTGLDVVRFYRLQLLSDQLRSELLTLFLSD